MNLSAVTVISASPLESVAAEEASVASDAEASSVRPVSDRRRPNMAEVREGDLDVHRSSMDFMKSASPFFELLGRRCKDRTSDSHGTFGMMGDAMRAGVTSVTCS